MTAGSTRIALDAIHSARPIVARLSTTRNSEDLAADLIEAWSAVEGGLRSLVGGSSLGGQQLIRELRTRHFLTLEQANALAEFHAARERAARTDYTPTEGDVNAARDAFLKLEAGLMGEPLAPAPGAARAGSPTLPMDAVGRRNSFTDAPPVAVRASAEARTGWAVPVLGLVALLVVGTLAWWLFAGRSPSSAAYEQGVAAYRNGQREAAAGAFNKASIDDPRNPMPHVYLARMAREQGNLVAARGEAVKAVELGPTSGPALRELASALFALQSYDPARTFFIRAIKADSTDRLSQGYLGCALVRLGRIEEGNRWIQRAGTGEWARCAATPGVPAARGIPPAGNPAVPMTIPR